MVAGFSPIPGACDKSAPRGEPEPALHLGAFLRNSRSLRLPVDVVVCGASVVGVLHVVAVGAVVVLVVVLVPGLVAGVMAMAVLVAMGVRMFMGVGMLVGVGGAVGMGVLMHVGVFVLVLMVVGRALVVAVGVAVDTRFVLRETTAVLAHGALLYHVLIVCSLPIEASAFQLTIEYSQNIGNQGA